MPLNSPTRLEPRPCLYVVATPIGNLADITLRAIDILSRVDLIAAEDTRHTRRLMSAHGISNKLISYHEHNEERRSAELIMRFSEGARIALVTNAGTPVVSDPGYRLITEVAQRGIPVIPIPGASAAMAALSVCGLPTNTFTFVGFPARKKVRRIQQIKELADHPNTLIFYQSPRRLLTFLDELIEIIGDRHGVLAREMTKIHEEFLRGPLSHIRKELVARDSLRGECTLLVHGAEPTGLPDDAQIIKMLESVMKDNRLPISDIVKSVADTHKLNKKHVYDLALKIKRRK